MLLSIEKINKIQQYLPKIQKIINIPNMNVNHLVKAMQATACSNLTTHHKTNYQHHKYRILQIFKQKLVTMPTPSTHFFIIIKKTQTYHNL